MEYLWPVTTTTLLGVVSYSLWPHWSSLIFLVCAGAIAFASLLVYVREKA